MQVEKYADSLKSIFKIKNSMILYIDETKNSETTNAVTVQFFNTETKAKHQNLDKYIDVVDVKLFAIERVIELCANKAYLMKITSNVWIYTNCVNTITRLKKLGYRIHLMQKMHKNCKMSYKIDHKIYLHWILEHVKFSRNVQADKQAKKELKKSEKPDNYMSFQYLNKRIEKHKFEKWNSMWQDNMKKGKYCKLHNLNLQQTFFQNFSNNEKLIFSTFLQIKMRHDFFKFYLCKLLTYESNRYNENCNEIQTSKHLLLNCHHYFNEQKQLEKNMKIFLSL